MQVYPCLDQHNRQWPETLLMYLKLGYFQKAKAYCYRALTFQNKPAVSNNHLWYTYDRLSQILLASNEPKEAKEISAEGLQSYPEAGSLWIDLAIAEYKLSNQQNALVAAEKAKIFSPGQQSDFVYYRILNNQPVNVTP